WYSKDMVLAQAWGFADTHSEHSLLLILPLITAGITAFYMFRMWFMTFTGEPRDEHVYEHAHETSAWMTVPLVLLAICSIIVAWGLPPWNAEQSLLGRHHGLLQISEPELAVRKMAGALRSPDLDADRVHYAAEARHSVVEVLALGVGAVGFL